VTGPTDQVLLVATVLTPLLLALPAARSADTGRWLLVLAALPAFLASLLVSDWATLELPWLLLGTQLGLDGAGRIILFASAGVWLAAALYALTGDGLRRFGARAGFALAMAGNFGVVLAQDPSAFFAWYALMSFAAYLLVVEAGDGAARRAGRVYIVLVVAGEVLILSGLLAAVQTGAPPTVDAARWLLWIGFGIKAGLVPLHFGLPLAYGAASTPGATALAGAMVNAGLLGWLRFLAPDGVPDETLGLAVIALGLAGAFYGALVGVMQSSARALLGYSSVSQMGLLAVGVGAGLAVPEGWPFLLVVVTLYAAHHGFAKAALFVGLGVTDRTGSRAAWLALALPAVALVGLPLTSGAVVKSALKAALPALPAPWPDVLAIGLPLAAVGTTLLMARLLFLAAPRGVRASTAGLLAWVAFAPLLLAVALGPWWIGPVPLPQDSWLTALWPGLSGAAIAGVTYVAWRHGLWRAAPTVPPGDVLVPLERVASALWQHVTPPPEPHHPADVKRSPGPRRVNWLATLLSRGERALTRWETGGIAVLLLALAVAAVSALRGS
jgi:formate hydrogenlyase subunit 3/multisubunit Na+/H+ antiporter MnhD subunit